MISFILCIQALSSGSVTCMNLLELKYCDTFLHPQYIGIAEDIHPFTSFSVIYTSSLEFSIDITNLNCDKKYWNTFVK